MLAKRGDRQQLIRAPGHRLLCRAGDQPHGVRDGRHRQPSPRPRARRTARTVRQGPPSSARSAIASCTSSRPPSVTSMRLRYSTNAHRSPDARRPDNRQSITDQRAAAGHVEALYLPIAAHRQSRPRDRARRSAGRRRPRAAQLVARAVRRPIDLGRGLRGQKRRGAGRRPARPRGWRRRPRVRRRSSTCRSRRRGRDWRVSAAAVGSSRRRS